MNPTTIGVIVVVIASLWIAGYYLAPKLKNLPTDEHAKALDYVVWLGNYAKGDDLLSEIRQRALEAKYPLPKAEGVKNA